MPTGSDWASEQHCLQQHMSSSRSPMSRQGSLVFVQESLANHRLLYISLQREPLTIRFADGRLGISRKLFPVAWNQLIQFYDHAEHGNAILYMQIMVI